MTIKAVIWDLGGVLVRTEDGKPRQKLAERLGKTRKELEFIVFGGETGTQAQVGEVTFDRHWDTVGKKLKLSPLELEAFWEQFFAGDLVDQDLIHYIRELGKKFKTALLSNMFSNLRHMVTSEWKFADVFDVMVISAEVGLVKPDPRIYNLVLQHLDVAPAEAVFIDDSLPNIIGAQAVGLHTIQFQDTQQVRQKLGSILNGEAT